MKSNQDNFFDSDSCGLDTNQLLALAREWNSGLERPLVPESCYHLDSYYNAKLLHFLWTREWTKTEKMFVFLLLEEINFHSVVPLLVNNRIERLEEYLNGSNDAVITSENPL